MNKMGKENFNVDKLNKMSSNDLYDKFKDILSYFETNTGFNKNINPEKNKEWETFALCLVNNGMYELAEIVYAKYYHKQTICQTEKRIHKGLSLHQRGWVNRFLGDKYKVRYFTLLALIEDMISEKNNYQKYKAYQVLRNEFGLIEGDFKKIIKSIENIESEENELIKYPESVLMGLDLTENKSLLFDFSLLNNEYFKLLVNKLKNQDDSNNSKMKGDLLEKVIFYLFHSINGIEVSKNVNVGEQKGNDKEYEIDLVLRNFVNHPLFKSFGVYILIECKNWKNKPGTEQLNHFISKLRFHNCRCGIFISRDGISGDIIPEKINRAKLTKLKTFHKDGITILELTLNDLEKIVNQEKDIISLLIQKYEEIRFDCLKEN